MCKWFSCCCKTPIDDDGVPKKLDAGGVTSISFNPERRDNAPNIVSNLSMSDSGNVTNALSHTKKCDIIITTNIWTHSGKSDNGNNNASPKVDESEKMIFFDDDDINEDYLKSTLKIIDESIEQIHNKSEKVQNKDKNISTDDKGIIGKFTAVTTNVGKYIDRTNVFTDQIAQGLHESNILLGRILEGLGRLHWAAAGLSMVNFVLQRVQQITTNRDDCLGLLKAMRDLGGHVTNMLLDGNQGVNVKESVEAIRDGAVWCAICTDWGSFKGFMLAETNSRTLQELRTRIEKLYPTLTLTEVQAIKTLLSKAATAVRLKLPPGIVGLEKRVEKVLEILDVGNSGTETRAVILHGIGGIGKSTLGDCVFDALHGSLGYQVKIDVDMNPTNDNILGYQKAIIDSVVGDKERQKENISTLSDGQTVLGNILEQRCKKPILLFLDNILNGRDLTTLFHRTSTFPQGSVIIVTSRDAHKKIGEILGSKEVACKYFQVDLLGDNAAKTLFLRQFRSPGPRPDLEKHIVQILKVCGGLALALDVVGKYLNPVQEQEDVWISTVDALQRFSSIDGSKQDELMAAIQFSYHNMDDNHKSAFLDIVCLLGGFPWDWLKDIYGNVLNNLVDRGLLKKGKAKPSWYTDYHVPRVRVHDLFRSLAQREQRGTRLNSHEDLCSYKRESHGEEGFIQGLVLKGGSVDAHQLDKILTDSLRIMVLDTVVVEGTCSRTAPGLQVYAVREGRLPLEDLSTLQRLKIFSARSTRSLFCPHPCEIEDPRIRRITVGEFPPSLKVLRIQNAEFRGPPPVLGSGLQELTIAYCEMKKLPEARDGLRNLLAISIRCNKGLEQGELPGSWKWGQLPATLQSIALIPGGGERGLEKLCGAFPPDSSLRYLDIAGNERLKSLGQNFHHVVQLEELGLTGCSSLEQAPLGIENLRALKVLRLSRWNKSLPLNFCNHLHSLEKLDLSSCESLTVLPPDFVKDLSSLECLDLSNCQNLVALPVDFGKLVALRDLNLRGCKKLSSLPPDVSNLSSLNLSGCNLLVPFMEDICKISSLERLHLGQWDQLASLPPAFCEIKALKVLCLDGCKELSSLPDDIYKLASIEDLSLRECVGLVSLPNSFGRLRSLTRLSLSDCVKMESLPKDFGELVSLTHLSLNRCAAMRELPLIGPASGLNSLKELSLGGCVQLASLPADWCQLSSLTALSLRGCDGVSELPSTLWDLKSLRILDVRGCKFSTVGWEQLENHVPRLSSLTVLSLGGSVQLTSLPADWCQLSWLTGLSLTGCKKLSLLPEEFCELKSLTFLYLSNCVGLHSLPKDFGKLTSLSFLDLSGCDGISELPSTFWDLKRLRVSVKGCKFSTIGWEKLENQWLVRHMKDQLIKENRQPEAQRLVSQSKVPSSNLVGVTLDQQN